MGDVNQQETFVTVPPRPVYGTPPRGLVGAAFLLGRAVAILEGLVESPTDAIDIQLAQDFLADYRKWRDS